MTYRGILTHTNYNMASYSLSLFMSSIPRTMRPQRFLSCTFQSRAFTTTTSKAQSQNTHLPLSRYSSSRISYTQSMSPLKRNLGTLAPLRYSSSNDKTTTSSSSSSTETTDKSNASTDASVNKTHYPDDEHVLDKGDTLDVQSRNSVEGRKWVHFLFFLFLIMNNKSQKEKT